MSNKENKVTTEWVYRVVLDWAVLASHRISLANSYIGNSFQGTPLTKLGYGNTTVFQLYEEKDGESVYTMENRPPIVKVPNETIRAMIPIKQVVCQDV